MTNLGLIMIGLGLTIAGTGVGIGLIGAAAVSSVGRQPEASGRIISIMLLSAALVEGLGLFGVVLAMNSM